jgi:Pvc16 N-terminal domain
MPDSGVVASVSETLLTVLANAVRPLDSPPPTAEIHDLQGNISTTPARLTIFLFEISEDPSARNRPRVRGVSGPNITESKPSMALVLRYLLTAWAGDRLTEHKLLGRAMQVLYDGPIVSGPDLQGPSLKNSFEVLKVTLAPLTLEERTRVWFALARPYRLSLSYEVRVVNLDSETSELRPPVSSRSIASSLVGTAL